MEGKRKILELDISTDKLKQKATELKKQLNELKEEKKQLKKATGDNSEAMAKNEAKIKAVAGQYRTAQKSLSGMVGESNKLVSVREKLNAALSEEPTTINKARQSNKDLLAIRNELNLATDEGLQQANDINEKMDKNNAFIKENASAYEKQKINIGNYKESINQAIQENGLFQGQLQGITQVFQTFSPILVNVQGDLNGIKNEYKEATKATAGMTNAQKAYLKVNKGTVAGLKLLRLALIGTGIGAIVVALGSLITFLSTTQKGIDKVNRVLTPMKEIFKGLLGVVQNFGETLFKAIKNPEKAWNNFIDTLESGYKFFKNNVIKPILAQTDNFVLGFRKKIKQARIAWNEFTGDDVEAKKLKGELDDINVKIDDNKKIIRKGAENVKKAYKKTTDAINGFFDEAIERGNKIQKIQENLNKTEAEFITNQQQLKKEFEEQKKISEDTTRSIEEREKAAERAIETQEELSKGKIKRIKQEGEIIRLKQQANDTSDEERANLAKKMAEIDKAIEEEAAKTTEAQNKLNSIRKEGEKKREKAIQKQKELENERFDEKITNLKEELDLFLAQQGTKAKSQREELKIASEVADRKKKILEERYKAGKISETEYQTELLRIKQEFAGKQSDIALNQAKQELERKQDDIEATVQNEIEKNNRLAKVEKEYQAERLEQGKINQRQYNAEIDRINEENRIANKEAEAEREKVQNELDLAKEQNKFEARFARKQQQLDKERQQAIAEAKRLGLDVTEIKEYFNDQQVKLDEEKFFAKSQMALSSAQSLANILGKETKAAKAVALAQAGLNLGKAISQANTVPFPANILAIAQATATGLKAIKDIRGVKQPNIEKPKLAKGGALDDSSLPGTETSDDIDAKLSKGESVINAKSTKKYKPLLSAINQEGGGVAFARGGLTGSTRRSVKQQAGSDLIDYDKIGESMAKNMPQAQVAVTEIRNKNARRAKVEERANHD